jgi:ribosomal protein S6
VRNYELIYILKPNLEEDVKETVLAKVKAIVEEGKAEIEKIDVWGNRKLAYEIEDFTDGYYVLISFKAGIDVPKEIDRNLKISDAVIRHMIVNIED